METTAKSYKRIIAMLKSVSDLTGPVVELALLEQDVAKTVAEIKAMKRPKAYTGFTLRPMLADSDDVRFYYLTPDMEWKWKDIPTASKECILSYVDVQFSELMNISPIIFGYYSNYECSPWVDQLKRKKEEELIRYLVNRVEAPSI